jgi:hypothetical protein
MLLAASGALTPNNSGRVGRIELRIYEDSVKNLKTPDLSKVAEAIRGWIKNPTQLNVATDGDLLPDNIDEGNKPQVSEDYFEIVRIDVSIVGDARSPSSGAMNKARELAGTIGGSITADDAAVFSDEAVMLSIMLTSRVIDIWLVFDSVPITNTATKNNAEDKSSAAQIAFQAALADFNKQVDSKLGK